MTEESIATIHVDMGLPKWEYTDRFVRDISELNHLGSLGWEAVTIERYDAHDDDYRILFKRPCGWVE